MVGFTLLSRSYYYLRRRSPGPPFPPDHRQAGERGAISRGGWGTTVWDTGVAAGEANVIMYK
jgi:hypothetical protein